MIGLYILMAALTLSATVMTINAVIDASYKRKR